MFGCLGILSNQLVPIYVAACTCCCRNFEEKKIYIDQDQDLSLFTVVYVHKCETFYIHRIKYVINRRTVSDCFRKRRKKKGRDGKK